MVVFQILGVLIVTVLVLSLIIGCVFKIFSTRKNSVKINASSVQPMVKQNRRTSVSDSSDYFKVEISVMWIHTHETI
jgi:hypothetical protein